MVFMILLLLIKSILSTSKASISKLTNSHSYGVLNEMRVFKASELEKSNSIVSPRYDKLTF